MIRVEGLKELRKELRQFTEQRQTELDKHLKEEAKGVAQKAASNAPRRSGALAASIKSGATMKGAYVRSQLPYAAAHEWGGRVGRNKSVPIRPTRYTSRALQDSEEGIVNRLDEELKRALRRLNG